MTRVSWCAALTLVLAAILFAARIDLPLLEPEETLYAEIPRQMLTHDRWLVPLRNGQDYLDKPPLLYWLVMASYQTFGVHVWSARLPAVVAAWLTVAVALGWAWRTAGPWCGVAVALTLTLYGDFVYRAPMLTTNGLLALFVTSSLAAAHIACADQRFRWRWWLLSAIACGLAILSKGLVGAVLTLGPIVAWRCLPIRVVRPKWWTWRAMVMWCFVAALIAAPWFVAVALRRPEFVEYFFWKHHVERFATPFDHSRPTWYFVPQLVLGFLPWTAMALWLGWRGDPSHEEVDARPLSRLALVAALLGFLFFSLAGSKRPVYLVAIEPLIAVGAGAAFWTFRSSLPSIVWFTTGVATALTLAGGIAFWLPSYSRDHSIAAIVPKEISADVPIFCYGHGWNGVAFHLQRDDVRDFIGKRRQEIFPELAKHPRSLVFVADKSVAEFEKSLPPDLRFERIAECGQARVGFATKAP